MFLFQLWIFNINFETIISFIFGIFFGIALICLIYAILVVASLGDKKFFIKTQDDSLTLEETQQLIIDAQKSFKDKKLRGKNGKVSYCGKLSTDLAYGIASRFYPKSKYPLLEISIDEAILLLEYIDKRIDDLLSKGVLKTLRRFKISFITDMSLKTTAVMNSRAFNVGKNVTKTITTAKKVINIINPLNWGKRIIVDSALSIAINKLCLIVIQIVGEETYKIYSKKVLNKEVDFESNVEELARSIDTDILKLKENNTEEKINLEYEFLKRYYNVENKNVEYDSIFDAEMEMRKREN